MFTGIIEQTGTLISLTDRGGVRRLTVEAPGIAGRLREGDSLAVSGVCLTALDVNPTYFHADLAQETLDRTSLGQLKPGARVNLELPVAAGSPLGGHVVQGHVDATGTVVALDPIVPETSPNFDRQRTDWTLKVRVPEEVRPWMVHKGSVAVEGISLTIAGFDGETITIAILPLTYWRTNLHTFAAGAPVNIEADVLVKLAAQRTRIPGLNTETGGTLASADRIGHPLPGPERGTLGAPHPTLSASAFADTDRVGHHISLNPDKAPEFELTEAWLVKNGY
jgi:riboflavin synthase